MQSGAGTSGGASVRYTVIFATIAVVALLGWAWVLWPPEDSGHMAAWLQAIGGCFAVVVAIWIPSALHRQALQQTQARERREVAVMVQSIREEFLVRQKMLDTRWDAYWQDPAQAPEDRNLYLPLSALVVFEAAAVKLARIPVPALIQSFIQAHALLMELALLAREYNETLAVYRDIQKRISDMGGEKPLMEGSPLKGHEIMALNVQRSDWESRKAACRHVLDTQRQALERAHAATQQAADDIVQQVEQARQQGLLAA